ncbi:efflux RND transporter periplasmic adaptor subunit, partial [bacterium]|nr:efflux RND transporter periplasmic adaptor subunit [bacterium]
QLLAQLDPSALQTQVDRARANLQKAQSSYNSAVASQGNAAANVKKMEAGVLSSKAKYKQAEASVSNSKASVLSSEANVRKAQAEYDKCKIDFERMQQLRAQDLIAQSDLDNAQASYRSAQASLEASQASLNGAKANHESAVLNLEGMQADLESARIQVEAAEQQLASAEAAVSGAKADVDQSKASLQSAEVDLGKTTICSPSDGIVLSVAVSEGQTVAAQYQAPELFTLANNLDEMQVQASVDEADIGQVKVGSDVTFTVDAWSDREFKGKVVEVRQAASTVNNVVTYPVIISTDNPDMCLMPGMTATVAITVEARQGVLLVPNAALRFKPAEGDRANVINAGGSADNSDGRRRFGESGEERDKKVEPASNPHEKTVYTLVKEQRGKIKKRTIVIGITDGTNTEVVSGDLQEGERVVTGSKELDKSKANARFNRRRGPGPF